jgi:hypothetical protein
MRIALAQKIRLSNPAFQKKKSAFHIFPGLEEAISNGT